MIVPGGKFGAEPAPPGTEFTYTVRLPDRLQSEEEFGEIVVRTQENGAQVKIKHIARVELGVETYNAFTRMNGRECSVIALYQAPGSNAVALAESVKVAMEELARSFPQSIQYDISLDATLPITAGINEIVVTLYYRPGPGDPGGVRLYPGLARHPDSHPGHSGLPAGGLHGVSPAGVHRQRALAAGLTIVAVGTSLPELASTLVAMRRNEHDIALGNIIGSNLFNTLAVVGLAAAIGPVAVPPEVLWRDVPVMVGLTIALVAACIGFGGQGRINRAEGAALLAVFIGYLTLLVVTAT